MTRFLKPLFLIVGVLLFIWAVRSVEVTEVSGLLSHIGAGFFLVVTAYGLVAGFDALSWKYAFKPEEAGKIHLFPLLRIRTIGEAFNAITPLGTLGGEPVKAHLLKEQYGLTYKQSAASQVVARTTLMVSLVLFMIPGIVFLFMGNDGSEAFKVSSLTGLITFSILIFLFLLFQVTGTLSRIAHGFNRLFPAKTPRASLEHLVALCGMMSGYYREHRGLFLKSVVYGFLGWAAGIVELYVTLYYLGTPLALRELWIIESLLQLVRMGSFFIPLSLGAQEGGLIVIFVAMGMAGPLGLAVSLVRRIRELIWIGLGLLLGWGKASGGQKETGNL
ncbi:MAG: flippase-like domain-containing protein [Nitrospinae bacterium]|nr:flippase-like domain-containing protein [Nitrospinota bacterium]